MSDRQQQATHLYRHFDARGNLLYVGISLSAVSRLGEHKAVSHWFDEIATVTVQPYPTREAALEAERLAIANENPAHNIKGKKVEKPTPVTPADQAGAELLRRVVSYQPVYSLEEVGQLMHMPTAYIKRLVEAGEIGSISLPPLRKGNHWKSGTPLPMRKRITGWQLIEYIEHLNGKPISK